MDKITGNHLKLGDEFEKGILTIGQLVLAMVGKLISGISALIVAHFLYKKSEKKEKELANV